MPAEHAHHLPHGLQSAAHGVGGPRAEEAFGCPRVVIGPEVGEGLLDAPCATGLQVHLVERTEGYRLGAAPIGVAFQPRRKPPVKYIL